MPLHKSVANKYLQTPVLSITDNTKNLTQNAKKKEIKEYTQMKYDFEKTL
jgi:hypothetical protein